MSGLKGVFTPAVLLIGIVVVALLASQIARPVGAAVRQPLAGELVVLAWNDLGMHCYNVDYADLAVLPPFNNLWVQVVRVGDPPAFVTTGITVSYSYAKNTQSASKTNFWQYEDKLFGVDLPQNVGLKGYGLQGEMENKGDHFVAEGIPITEFNDDGSVDPFQVASVVVKDKTSGKTLAQTQVVTPVSSEMRCDTCHSDTGIATVTEGITPHGDIEQNILALHDKEHMDDYPTGHTEALMSRRPVLCAECHGSNALGAPGVNGLPNLSRAMHNKHSDVGLPNDTNGCYGCHPGPQTRCLRDVMWQQEMQCQNCHGKAEQVALSTRNPWLQEPRCDNAACHGSAVQQDQPLYRMSHGHAGLYCAACHDSPHAIAPSREANDQMKFWALQDTAGPLTQCTVCHATQPSGAFTHRPIPITGSGHKLYLPLSKK